ncbi:MAG: fimbrial biogenesis chaperone [Serratia sp. (in: enterobacteria)]|uniref:fimbrial biogenesis chaperone n=1 Tax=Serratia sp. (in: enterobacteria) TaxID=616 RepID=UPI003F2E3777
MHKATLLAVFFLSITNTHANIVINGTRILYHEKSKEVIVQLINNGDSPALVQSWIDDGDIKSTPETANVPFLLSPPVIKVNPNNGQHLRIKKLPAKLPTDRESVFFLNVLDIPPFPENLHGQNTVQLAIKSRIKLFYRPAVLNGSVDSALSKLKFISEEKQFRIINESPFNITIANIENIQKDKLLNESLMISPFTHKIALTKKNIERGQMYSVMYVDDQGAYKYYTINSQ